MKTENTNGDNITWETDTGGWGFYAKHGNAYDEGSFNASITWGDIPMDDWFFTQGLDLVGGVTYTVTFVYRNGTLAGGTEKFAVDWGNAPNSAAMSGAPIFNNSNVKNIYYYIPGKGTFTPSVSDTYYVGFHGYSDAYQADLFIDDVRVIEQIDSTTWTGSTDNDWDKPSNWTNGLPSSGTDVTIPAGLTDMPVLNHASIINSILIESGPSGDASVLYEGYVFENSATVQRYITGGMWHNLSVPVIGETVNALYFGGNPDVWLRKYNEPTNDRSYITNLTDTLYPGAGFEVWVKEGNDITINFTGNLQSNKTTDIYVGTSTTGASLSYTGPDPLGYNLIGNPYAGPIDLDEGTWSRWNVTTSFWVWDPNSGTGGTYLDWNTATGTGSLTGGIIPTGQGFFCQATDATAEIRIPFDSRIHSTTGFYKYGSENEEDDPLSMSLYALMDNGYDEMNIAFLEEATEEFDIFDTRKMFAFEGSAPQIYSEQSDEELSINGLPLLNENGYEVKVGYRAGVNGEQQLTANLENLPETEVLLEDLFTGNIQDLVDNPVYTFDGSPADAPTRFILHFNPVFTDVKEQPDESNIKIYAYDGSVYIRSKGKSAKEEKEVWIYDMFGRTVLETKVSPSILTKIPVHRRNTYFVVKTVSTSGVTTSKVYIK